MSLRDIETSRHIARLELEADIAADFDTSDEFFVVEPCRVPPPCVVPVRPGYAGAARRAGCEDEYDNEMGARYGDAY